MRQLYFFFFGFLVLTCSIHGLDASKEGGFEEKELPKYYLAICAIFQNEAPYLKEWIEFHRLVGVQHFYLYNNLSTDNFREVLQPYLEEGFVELTEWPREISPETNWCSIQCAAYTHAIKKFKHKAKWIAFIDTDEFLIPVKNSSLVEALAPYEECAGVSVHWQMYGTSYVKKIPDNQLLIETLLYKAVENHPKNHSTKSIVRPKKVHHFQNPHYAEYRKGQFQVDENYVRFEGSKTQDVSIHTFRINHYWTRDEDYFYNVKLASRKNRGWSIEQDSAVAKELNDQFDAVMDRYVPALRARLGFID